MKFLTSERIGYDIHESPPYRGNRTVHNREILHTRDYFERTARGRDNLIMMKYNSIPTGFNPKTRNPPNPKTLYHIEYVLDVFESLPNVNIKFLYLERNFFRTVLSHPSFDGGFEPHALMMEKYARFIRSEYYLTEARKPNLWRKIHYEWLQLLNLEQFGVLIIKLIEFLEWKDCANVDMVDLHSIIQPSRNYTVYSRSQHDFSMGLDFHIDIPPVFSYEENFPVAQDLLVDRVPDDSLQSDPFRSGPNGRKQQLPPLRSSRRSKGVNKSSTVSVPSAVTGRSRIAPRGRLGLRPP